MPTYLYVAFSIGIAFCMGIVLNARVKIAVYAAIFGGICYYIYAICNFKPLGYFLGAFVLAILAEIAARAQKTPATAFLVIGIAPLVPGAGIYKTMMLLIQSEYIKALEAGTETFSEIILMTTAIAIVIRADNR